MFSLYESPIPATNRSSCDQMIAPSQFLNKLFKFLSIKMVMEKKCPELIERSATLKK